MSFSRTKSAGWAVNEVLTSAQMNDIDIKTRDALDKTVAGDTLSGIVACSGVGRVRDVVAAGADADTTYSVGTVRSIRVPSTLTANRVYTFNGTGAAAGDRIVIWTDPAFQYRIDIRDSGSVTNIWSVGHQDATALSVSVTIEYDGSAWKVCKASRPAGIRYQVFTANGTWTCPAGVRAVILEGYGGGGSGGGGDSSGTSTSRFSTGGAGGGGAKVTRKVWPVVPGTTYTVTVGAGGASAAADTVGNAGASTTFTDGSTTFTALGGGGGGAGQNTSYNNYHIVGGGPEGQTGAHVTGGTTDVLFDSEPVTFGRGGTVWSTIIVQGTGSGMDGNTGGAGGANGTDSGTYYRGTGGGGGAAGPGGNGGAAGAGGNGNNAGAGTAGSAGTAASANTGAGGGGGGGGGAGSGSGGAGGASGAGGSGKLTIIWA